MKFWPTSLPSVILAPHLGAPRAGAVVGALAELGGVATPPPGARWRVWRCLATTPIWSLARLSAWPFSGHQALLGEGAGVVEALVGVLGGDEGEGLALEEGPRPVGGEGEAHVAAVEVGEPWRWTRSSRRRPCPRAS